MSTVKSVSIAKREGRVSSGELSIPLLNEQDGADSLIIETYIRLILNWMKAARKRRWDKKETGEGVSREIKARQTGGEREGKGINAAGPRHEGGKVRKRRSTV